MDSDAIKELLNTSEYDFLRNDKHLGNNIIMLNLGGSLAYGTNLPGLGDVDIRGITMERSEDIIGFGDFEVFTDDNTDTVIYGFNKIVKLLCNANPNTIEMLGCKPEHYFYLSETGKMILDNKQMFLSQKAARAFGGYADQQLNRMMNALARDRVTQAEKEEHILRSMESSMYSFADRYKKFDKGSIVLNTIKSNKAELDTEVVANINLTNYPVRDFNSIMNELSNVSKVYDKISHRNHKKDDTHLNKHAMHLVRLFLMGIDILEKEEINTYREEDKDMLLDIRKGKYMKEDGTYRNEFFEILKTYQDKFDYACQHTSLPEAPNMKKVEEFVMEVNKKAILNQNEMIMSKELLENDIER